MIANRTPIRTTLCDLQVLWGSPGIIGVLLRFLDLSSITSLPALAQRFAADHSRVLFMLARATPTLERRLMEVLSDNGYDAVRFRQRWEGPLRANWMRDDAEQDGHGRVPPVDIRKRRSGSGPCFLSITHGGLVWPVTGSRNCVTRFKVLFRYGDLDTGAPSFELASRADPQSWNKRGPPPFLSSSSASWAQPPSSSLECDHHPPQPVEECLRTASIFTSLMSVLSRMQWLVTIRSRRGSRKRRGKMDGRLTSERQT